MIFKPVFEAYNQVLKEKIYFNIYSKKFWNYNSFKGNHLILDRMPINEKFANTHYSVTADQGYLLQLLTVVKHIEDKTLFPFIKLFENEVN